MTPPPNPALSLLRSQLQAAHGLLEGTIGDVSTAQAHWAPGGLALPIGATYAHVVLSEDATINALFRGGAPLFATAWAGKAGVSEPPPGPDPHAPGFPDWRAWGQRERVDLPALRTYAQAVYAGTDGYLATLQDADLTRPVDLSALGLGPATMEYVLTNGVLGNALTHCGEISCLKGLQGTRGYPF
ncbi:MAG: DinB family protein [Deferrisomatales bacterium]